MLLYILLAKGGRMLAGESNPVHAVLTQTIIYTDLDNHEIRVEKDTPILVDIIKNIALIDGEHIEVFQNEYSVTH